MKRFILFALISLIVFSSCDWFKSQLGGAVKGTISNATSGFVVLINNVSFIDSITNLTEEGLKELTNIVKGLGLITSSGSYEILAIPAGTYYLLALIDGNGNKTLDSTDMIGWYGTDTTFTYDTTEVTITKPQTLTFEEKENKTGININRLISKKDFELYYNYITTR